MSHTAHAPAQGILSTLATRVAAAFERVALVLADAQRLRAEAEKRFPHTAE